jgi:hypothetical protein
VRSRPSRNVRYASNTDRIDAPQQNVASARKRHMHCSKLQPIRSPRRRGRAGRRRIEAERLRNQIDNIVRQPRQSLAAALRTSDRLTRTVSERASGTMMAAEFVRRPGKARARGARLI